jgi:hypothetical protein
VAGPRLDGGVQRPPRAAVRPRPPASDGRWTRAWRRECSPRPAG